MRDLLTGLAVLATVAALFGLGWYLGRRTEVQRQVDDAFRRETRLRHPARFTKDSSGGVRQAHADGRCSAAGCEYYRQQLAPRRAQPAPWPVRGLSAREEMADAGALSVSVRPYVIQESVDPAGRHHAARGPEWPT